MRTSCDKMISTRWSLLVSSSCAARWHPSTLYVGHRKHNSVHHLGHSDSCTRAFFYCPPGAFKMDLSPSFIRSVTFLSAWIGPCEDAHSTSFTVQGRARLQKKRRRRKKGSSGLLPSFIVLWSHLLNETGPASGPRESV